MQARSSATVKMVVGMDVAGGQSRVSVVVSVVDVVAVINRAEM